MATRPREGIREVEQPVGAPNGARETRQEVGGALNFSGMDAAAVAVLHRAIAEAGQEAGLD